ncbi:MAG TPA: Ig-like domain-containing protein [Thermoanaerobaculia bacterium]|jgi:hypothetical protein|nr:Ig-like domain-containing protein [Thermoanaerobaculia bacterium]
MRSIAACLVLLLAGGLPALESERDAKRPADRTVVRAPKAAPEAGQPRRRAVRKTPPAGPIARADAYSVVRGGALVSAATAGVLLNDTNPQSLTAILVTSVSNGTLTLNADGGFTYLNNGSAATTDSFTYKANNGTVDTNVATVTITITSPPPLAVDDVRFTTQNTTLLYLSPGVLVNDTVNGATVTSYGIIGTEQTTAGANTPTSHGTVNITATGGLTYTPATDYLGNDSLHYVITNSAGSSSARVDITVTPFPPVAVNDDYSTPSGVQLNIAAPGILGNDTLNTATILSYGAPSGNEQPTLGEPTPTATGGVVRLNADGSFRYDPAGAFTGNDTFQYTIINGFGSTTATVTIAVQANAIDFTVTSPGFFFQFSGVSGANPLITLTRGRTYRFRIQTDPVHPFEILNAPNGSISNNNINNGILIFAVPAGPGLYQYHCPIHSFGGDIDTTQ